MYAFNRVPDIGGIMMNQGKMFAVLGYSSDSGNALNTYKKLVPLSFGGKNACKSMNIAEIGVFWTTNSCVRVKKFGATDFEIRVVSKFKYKNERPEDWEFLKSEDFVRQRDITIRVALNKASCSAVVTRRTYVPLDKKTVVASRTGPIGCALVR
ncbi:hypothetical protein [Jiella sonneratiae]|uniref:Uncharacterized protein n=1 Tax=Jiella sonneratiae TaxID=2816856 RepID=A0ABS3IXK0_9HYPH|nr:hypothetical protein [Jiella sonneratiae]MBO0902144.1 hypothetical protein [Jiella sonneratiae]